MGAGVLTLSGADNYSGATSINTGTLQAGATNVLSSNSAFNLANGATLNLGGFDNAIGSLTGSGSVALGAATLTAGNDGTSTNFAGSIDGTGGLVKTGAGTLTLTGMSNYAGPTTVAAGTLDVDGTLASIATVDSGATLKDDGTLGGLTVASGGQVAPGNSIGTLNIAGNVSFASGSIYQVETNAAGAADKIAASGTTTLSGGHVQVLAQSGNYSAQTYTILTSASGVAGTFSDVTSDLAFLTPTLSYDADDVFLTLTRNATFFSSLAETPNQRGVASALDAASPANPVVAAVSGQNAGGRATSFRCAVGRNLRQHGIELDRGQCVFSRGDSGAIAAGLVCRRLGCDSGTRPRRAGAGLRGHRAGRRRQHSVSDQAFADARSDLVVGGDRRLGASLMAMATPRAYSGL